MKILLTGAQGQLGRCFKDVYSDKYQLIALDSKALDITNEALVIEAIAKYKPEVVINAAAYTAVDRAEEQPEQAFLVNAIGPKHLAKACANANIELIHVSTDYVFDGTNSTPYTVDDAPNPINVYGKSKLAGELLVLAHHPTARIIRTSWVYSEYGHNFLKTMLRLAQEGKEVLTVVSDQYGCPTYAGNLAKAIDCLINDRPNQRLFHYSDGVAMSWYEFTKEIFANIKVEAIQTPSVQPISSLQYASFTQRPQYSVLHNSFVIENKASLQEVINKL